MTLTTDFQAAYSNPAALGLSNPDSPEAITDNTTRIGLAADAAEGYFEMYVGVSYDGTDKRHLALGVEGVEIMLRKRATRPTGPMGDLNEWIRRLEQLGKQTARAMVNPRSTSSLVPKDEPASPPVFDRANMGDMLLQSPRSTSNSFLDRSFD